MSPLTLIVIPGVHVCSKNTSLAKTNKCNWKDSSFRHLGIDLTHSFSWKKQDAQNLFLVLSAKTLVLKPMLFGLLLHVFSRPGFAEPITLS